MKRRLLLAVLAMLVAVTLPGLAEARGGHGGGGGHGFGGGGHGFGGGFRGFGGGFRGYGGYGYGIYPGYYAYGGCWRWVEWPYPHRAYVCY